MRLKKKINNSDYSEKTEKKINEALSVSRQTDILKPFVSEHKQSLIEKVLHNRTRKIVPVLEDVYHPQNSSAVIRTCECFGIQDVIFIEDKHLNETSPRVVQGSDKWMTIRKFSGLEFDNPTMEAVKYLDNRQMKLYATTPDPEAVGIDEVELHPEMALVFGTELHGISDLMKSRADYLIRVPMNGFTDSYNLSVSAALVLQLLIRRYKQRYSDWNLSQEEKDSLRLDWYRKIVNRSDLILKRAL